MKVRFTRAGGLEIHGVPLGIDARTARPLGIITHAHADHTARHARMVATPETALLLGERWKRAAVRAVPFDQTIALAGARVTLLGSGHILGSAMVLLEHKGKRLLYTGDLRTQKSVLFAGARPVPCDVLVMESTFGLPHFKFPPLARARQLLRAFVDAARASGHTPVLTGYALGKAQELVALLGAYRETIWAHPRIARFCELYRSAGIQLPAVEVPAAGAPPGALVVMPPNFARTEWRGRIHRPRVCFCSGWALDRERGWHAADVMVPLSDHADCADLVRFARATGAGRIYTLHGFAGELAALLRGEGLEAEPAAATWPARTQRRRLQFSTETLDLFES